MKKFLALSALLFISAITTSAQIRVTTSATAYKDSQGNTWSPDTPYESGGCNQDTTTHAISYALPSLSDQALYQPERWGSACVYTFTVTNGNYNVTLKFSENAFAAPAARVFNVTINGTTVLTGFDIYAAALAQNGSGQWSAIDKTFPVTVTGGQVVVSFVKGTVNYAKIDSIAVLPVTQPPPNPPSTPIVTNVSANVTLALACGTSSTTPPIVHSASLNWTPSISPGVTGYNVYRSTVNGTAYAKIGSTTTMQNYMDSSVQSGLTYYYVVTAVAPPCPQVITPTTPPCGESGFSNQATAAIP